MATVQRTKAPATTKTNGSKTAATSASSALAHAPIAQRAYEIWRESGCPHGHDQEHWFQAERELRAKLAMRS